MTRKFQTVNHELIVAQGLSNHPNDKQEALPILSAIDPRLGRAEAAAMDNSYIRESNITGCEMLGILTQ
jgi:hypothetical protein